MDTKTQILWLLWCEPCKKTCWYYFQETKRYIYRCCCKPLPKNSTRKRRHHPRQNNNMNLDGNNNSNPSFDKIEDRDGNSSNTIERNQNTTSSSSSSSFFSWFFRSNTPSNDYKVLDTELSNLENSESHHSLDQKKRVALGDVYGSQSSRLYSGDMNDGGKLHSHKFITSPNSNNISQENEQIPQPQKTKRIFLGELYGSQSSKLYGEKPSSHSENNNNMNNNTSSLTENNQSNIDSKLPSHQTNPIQSHQSSIPYPNHNQYQNKSYSSLSASSPASLLNSNQPQNVLQQNHQIHENIGGTRTIGQSPSSLSPPITRIGNEGGSVGTGIAVKPKKQSLGELYSSQSSKYYGNQTYTSTSQGSNPT